jgi:PKD repeat protein
MKTIYYYCLLCFILFTLSIQSMAQNFDCGTTQAQEKLYHEHPELRQQQALYDEYVLDYLNNNSQESNRNLIVIPIVFHIIHDYGVENIPDENIFDQVAILNRDYNRLNPDTSSVVRAFKSNISNVGIEFRLAQKDPQGNCTNGIDRIASPLTYLGNDAAKLNPWDRRKYLNVWVVKKMENGVAGYAYKPVSVSGMNFKSDGIIILADYIGSLSPSSPNTSRALTHEIGHWLNLSHPWGDTNSPEVACGDDGIYDTPITKGHKDCVPVADYTCDIKNITNAIYTFDNVSTSTGNIDPTLPPSQINGNVVNLNFSNFSAIGIGANSLTNGVFNFDNYDNGALDSNTNYADLTGTINTSKYFTFSITPETSQAMTLSSLTFKVSRNNEGIRTFVVRSSIDNYTSNLNATVLNIDSAKLSIQTGNIFYIKNDNSDTLTGAKIVLGSAFANLDNTVTFRIYAYNSESSNGTFQIDDINLTGTFGTVENVQNYMDYSYCSKMFTDGQKIAMMAALNSDVSFRNNLWTNDNLLATGVLNPIVCTPKADFFTTSRFVCEGSNVIFKDNTVNSAPTQWLWSFPGGSPSSSNVQNPTVMYSTSGYYPVSLTVSNSSGSNALTKQNYVYVSPNWSDYNSSYTESFEDAGLSERWFKLNPSNNIKQWQRVSDVGASGTSSMMLNGFYQGEGDVDELITPSYDLRYMTNLSFSFKYVGASKATNIIDMHDSLNVYVSTDCGRTWGTPKLTIKRANLIKAGQTDGYYKPQPGDAWTTASVNLASGTYAVANVRFRFRYTSGQFTNNFYLDDINIGGIVSLNENQEIIEAINIIPNPFENEATIQLFASKSGKVAINLLDITGRKVANIFKGEQNTTSMNYKFEKQNISAGTYIVEAQIGETIIYKKVIIN